MPVVSDGLKPLEWHALKVAGRSAEACRNELAVARNQPVDILVRIRGTISVGPDTTGHATKAPSPEAVLATAAEHVAVKFGNMAADFMIQAVRDLLSGPEGDKAAGMYPEWLASAKECVKVASVTRDVDRSGAVTGRLTIGLVQLEQVTQQVATCLEEATRIVLFEEDEKLAQQKVAAS